MLGIVTSLLYSVYFAIRLIYWYGEALFRNFIAPPPLKSLDGETILVTGCSRGIGRAIVRHLANSTRNSKLVLWGVNQRGMEALAQELNRRNGSGIRVFVYQVDISKREHVQKASALVKNDVGPVTVLINNAGIGPVNQFLEFTDSEIEQTLQINLMSHLWLLRAFLGDMMSANHGRIMNICTIGALAPVRCALPYLTSKFGVAGWGEALKAELEYFGYDGIHVTTVFPSVTKTEFIRSFVLDREELPGWMPADWLIRAMEPEEVAQKAVEGMQRELEYVYLPQAFGIVPGFDCLIPMKQRKANRAKFATLVSFSDPEDRRKFGVGHRHRSKAN